MKNYILLVLCVLILFSTNCFCLNAQSKTEHSLIDITSTPEVRGLKDNIAKQVIKIAKLKHVNGTYYISSEKWSTNINPHIIYIQSIPANKNIPVGTEIGTWRLGKATESQKLITVPDFHGINITDAIETCKKNNLSINQKFIDQSAVVDQFPKKGSKVYEGTFIFFTTERLSSDKNK